MFSNKYWEKISCDNKLFNNFTNSSSEIKSSLLIFLISFVFKLIGKNPKRHSKIFWVYFSKIFCSMHKDNLGINSKINFKFLGSFVSSIRSIIIIKNLFSFSRLNHLLYLILFLTNCYE